MCHEIIVAAFEAAGDPERYPELGEPWQPLKLYYHHSLQPAADAGAARRDARPRPGVAVGRAARGVEAASPSGTRGSPPGCRARTTSASATRRCSRTPPRSTPTASGSRSRVSSRSEVWPTEDYELVASHVETRLPEDDLFAGIDAAAPRDLRDWSHDCWTCVVLRWWATDQTPEADDVKAGPWGRDHDRRPDRGRGVPGSASSSRCARPTRPRTRASTATSRCRRNPRTTRTTPLVVETTRRDHR